ncbi:glycine betaine ABC transporter substrate-binding protein [Cellulomonas massiliensis]|uniref:glycine betaine ABC transporter substrate-binding protein n=1 Tax=Cellulomonas massiliensis TaxID=1465811 RepID=UPI000474845E|nr:glycine betaine ABC transporter substrate-binding protein [Cellulomonas massiliensis]
MRATRTIALSALAAATLLLGACGTPGSGGGQAAPTSSGSAGLEECAPIADQTLVVLEDDKQLQNADNVIPAVNSDVAAEHPDVVELLDTVSAALDTDKLIALNKAVDIDRQTSSDAAKTFVADEGLAAPEKKDGAGKLVVGAANFSESSTLAEVYAEVLRTAGYDASVQTVGNRETYAPQLAKGTLAVFPEYAATFAEYLNAQKNGADATPIASPDVDATVTAMTPLAEEYGVTLGTPSAAQDQNAFAVTKKFADEHQLTTLSDLAETCSGVVMAGPPECPERPFCQLGLKETYGIQFGEFKSFDFGLIGQALRQGDAAIGVVSSSDGSLAAG